MKIFSALPALVLLLTASRVTAAPDLFLQTNLYIYKNSDVHDVTVPAKQAFVAESSRFFKSPAFVRFDEDVLSLEGDRFTWNGGDALPTRFSSIASPAVTLPVNRAVSIMSSVSVQYLEKQDDGTFRSREIPGDSPDAPHCRLTFTVGPTDPANDMLALACLLDIATIGARETIPGLSLPAGKPILARFNEKPTLSVRLGQWSALLLPAPNRSDYSLLLLMKVVPVTPPSPALTRTGTYQLHTPRFGAAAVAQGDYVYVIGGSNTGGILGDMERFDVHTHESKVLTSQLIPRHHQGAVLLDGKIYIFGGQGYPLPQSSGFEPALEIYDLATGTLTKGAPLPAPRAYFAAAALNGKIYAIGGAVGDYSLVKETNGTDIYDPATNTWSAGRPMPSVRETRGAVVTNGAIIVAGGYRAPNVSTGLKAVELFLAEKNQWFALPDLGQPIAANATAVLGSYIYFFGNFDPADQAVAYNWHTHTTTVLQEKLTTSSQAVAVAHDGAIYVIGGTGGGGRERTDRNASGDIQVFVPTVPR